MKKILLLAGILVFSSLTLAQSTNVFKGYPVVKISEGGFSRSPEKLEILQAKNLACVITQIDDQYYWASRENIQLTIVDAGAFTTFVAKNGSGYVRVIKSEFKQAASQMSNTEQEFDYIEHLILGLMTITYFGISDKK